MIALVVTYNLRTLQWGVLLCFCFFNIYIKFSWFSRKNLESCWKKYQFLHILSEYLETDSTRLLVRFLLIMKPVKVVLCCKKGVLRARTDTNSFGTKETLGLSFSVKSQKLSFFCYLWKLAFLPSCVCHHCSVFFLRCNSQL